MLWCKTITFAYKIILLTKIWKGLRTVALRSSNPTEECCGQKAPKLKCQVILQHIPGLKTVSWGQCTLYFSLVSADQSVQKKLLKNKNKHRNKLIASLLIRLCLASSVKDDSDRAISYKAVSWLADKQHFRFGQTEENRDCCAAPVKSKSQRK